MVMVAVQPKTFDIGDRVRITATFSAPPTNVTLKVKDPASNVTTPIDNELNTEGATYFEYEMNLTLAGTYQYRWAGTGAAVAAGEGSWRVRKSAF